jgi:hypothetical protein
MRHFLGSSIWRGTLRKWPFSWPHQSMIDPAAGGTTLAQTVGDQHDSQITSRNPFRIALAIGKQHHHPVGKPKIWLSNVQPVSSVLGSKDLLSFVWTPSGGEAFHIS